MTVMSDYVSGTITLTNGVATFTGTGTGWQSAGFREGDTIIDITGATEYMGVIASITGEGAGTLTKAWEGPTITAAYRMRYQPDGSRVTAQARQLIEILGNGNLTAFASLDGAANMVPMFNGPASMVLVPKTDLVSGADYDVQVDDLAARAAYDGQAAGYAVLVADVGDGRAAIYSKNTATSGDWSDPAYVTGPVGPMPTIEAGTVTTVPFGTPANVEVVPIVGGYQLDFDIPQGAQGEQGPAGPQGEGLQIDASGPLASRSTFDNEAEGFTFLATDTGEYFRRETAVAGTWSTGIQLQGPPGASGATITTTDGVGDGTAGPYTLDAAPTGLDAILSATITGVDQYDISVVGDQITFGQAIPVGVPWRVRAAGPLAIGTPSNESVGAAQIKGDEAEDIREKLGAAFWRNAWTSEAATWYVSNEDGDDDAGDGSLAFPFKTPQRAIDEQLPGIVHKQKIILLNSATPYVLSSRLPSSMPRASLIYIHDHFVAGRTDIPGGVMDGFLVISGESKAGVILETSADFPRLIYNERIDFGLEHVTLRSNHADTDVLAISHRPGSYLHLYDVDFDGNTSADFSLTCEAGGWAEAVNCSFGDAAISDVFIYAGGKVNLAGSSVVDPSVGPNTITIAPGGYLQVNAGVQITGKIYGQQGTISLQGSSGSRVAVAALEAKNCNVMTTYTDLSGLLTLEQSITTLAASGWSNTLALQGGMLNLEASNSFISPADASTVAEPLVVTDGGIVRKDSASNITKSGGTRWAEKYDNNGTATIAADAAVIPFAQPKNRHKSTTILNAAANRANCTLAAVVDGTTEPPPDGHEWTIVNYSANIGIVNGTTAYMGAASNATISVNVGGSPSITLRWVSALGRWVELHRAAVRT